jgi:alginate O-acetyltransferase complex protein AlgI
MLFNSVIFILIFLPISVTVYYFLLGKNNKNFALLFLVLCSLFFYGWWEPKYLLLIIISVVVNYSTVHFMNKSIARVKLFLIAGIIFNLGLLGFFKYFDLLVLTVNEITSLQFNSWHIVLPLAISFFTFQQIAYLVDAAQGKVKEQGFLNYILFVTFFPQLIAGPIVHHSEMMPQFKEKLLPEKFWENISVGLTIFTIGLFKKVVLAEQMAYWADKTFAASNMGVEIGMLDAWTGVLCFSFQVYFDFSGYTDMAMGAARLFGIKLPLNFFSPYKASNIIEFWRSWHITLSRFLRDYLYVPLGGNKFGTLHRFKNLFIVMLLGGLWHGAGYNFIIWGGLHGLYLSINHAWHYVFKENINNTTNAFKIWSGRMLTFLLVTYAWVYFRSDSLDSAINMSNGLMGLNGTVLPMHYAAWFGNSLADLQQVGIEFGSTITYGGGMQIIWIVAMFGFVWLLPNTQEILRRYQPAIDFHEIKSVGWMSKYFIWSPNIMTGLIMSIMAISLIILILQGQPGEFIYFQF